MTKYAVHYILAATDMRVTWTTEWKEQPMTNVEEYLGPNGTQLWKVKTTEDRYVWGCQMMSVTEPHFLYRTEFTCI